jgi:hypothetical protein
MIFPSVIVSLSKGILISFAPAGKLTFSVLTGDVVAGAGAAGSVAATVGEDNAEV